MGGLRMKKFKVGVLDRPSMVWNGTETVSGYEFEFLKVLAQSLNFKFETMKSEVPAWGTKDKDGNWTGLIGMVSRKEVDFAISSVTVSESRLEAADFSYPYEVQSLSFAILKSQLRPRDFNFLKPFEFSVWLCILGTIIACSVILGALMTLAPKKNKSKCQKIWGYSQTIVDALENQFSNRDLPKKYKTRASNTMKIFWEIFKMVLCYSYVGLLLSFLMTPIREKQIRTFADLAEASRRGKVKVSATGGTYISTSLLTSNEYPFKDLGKHVRENPSDFLYSFEDSIAHILRGGASIAKEDTLKMIVNKAGKKDEVFISSSELRIVSCNIAFRKGFRYIHRFNEKIFRITQSGIYDKFKHDQMFRLFLKAKKSQTEEEIRPITFSDIQGILFVISPFYVFSIIVLFIEKWYYRHCETMQRENRFRR